MPSRSPQGERGLKPYVAGIGAGIAGRSPQGERGLKLFEPQTTDPTGSRSPQGERGLKLRCRRHVMPPAARRSPQGERGLKLGRLPSRMGHGAVAPRKGSVG